MATTALSYYIWKETRYEFAPSMPNKIRLRRVAMGLIETGFIYFAVQFSYFIVIAIGWYEWTHGSNQPSVDLWWAEEVTNAMFAVIPVRWLVGLLPKSSNQACVSGNSNDSNCRKNQHL